MAERPEDLNLPITVVQRIIKEALPDGVVVSKEARQTISRASSVFVLYLTACAVTHANKSKRKTLAVNDILSAIEDMEFDSFIQPLNEALKSRKNSTSTKKQSNNKNLNDKTPNKLTVINNEDIEDEIEDEIIEDENEEELENMDENGEDNDENLKEQNDGSLHQNKKRKLSKPDENINGNSNDSNENQVEEENDDDDDNDDEDEYEDNLN